MPTASPSWCDNSTKLCYTIFSHHRWYDPCAAVVSFSQNDEWSRRNRSALLVLHQSLGFSPLRILRNLSGSTHGLNVLRFLSVGFSLWCVVRSVFVWVTGLGWTLQHSTRLLERVGDRRCGESCSQRCVTTLSPFTSLLLFFFCFCFAFQLLFLLFRPLSPRHDCPLLPRSPLFSCSLSFLTSALFSLFLSSSSTLVHSADPCLVQFRSLPQVTAPLSTDAGAAGPLAAIEYEKWLSWLCVCWYAVLLSLV